MTIVEHNDVDISKLFIWKQKFEIVDENNEVIQEIYLRVLGDADLNRARVYALRESALLRSLLKSDYSDEHYAYIHPIDEFEKEQLVNLISALSMRELSKAADKEVVLKKPKSPKSDASTEELEKYQKEIDNYPIKKMKLLKDSIEKKTEELVKSLQEKPKKELYDKYTELLINELCEQELLHAFRERTTFLATYKDEDLEDRVFTMFEDFQNLPRNIKDQFMVAYDSLEIYGESLKKLRQATP